MEPCAAGISFSRVKIVEDGHDIRSCTSLVAFVVCDWHVERISWWKIGHDIRSYTTLGSLFCVRLEFSEVASRILPGHDVLVVCVLRHLSCVRLAHLLVQVF